MGKAKPSVPSLDESGSEKQLSGASKGAILLLTLGPERSTKVLKLLEGDVLENVTREIASIDLVDQATRGRVVEEFYNLALARRYAEAGGLGYAKALLGKALPADEAMRIMQQIEHQVHRQPFSFLQKTESENLLTFIQEEHPQTIALILAHLPSSKSAELMAGLPTSKQLEVVARIANMEQTNPEVIKEVEQGLELRLSGLTTQTLERAGGVESVAEILNLSDRATEKGILEALESEDPDLVEQIRRLMFVFEDVMLVDDKGIQSVLKEIDNDELSLALKTATEELKEKIFGNMSERAAQLVKEDMEYMGPVRISDVESAQQRIVDVVRRLEDSGEIIISGRGGEKELIV